MTTTTEPRPFTPPQHQLITELLAERYISGPEYERLRVLIRNMRSTKQATQVINRLKRLPFKSEVKA